MKVGGGSRKKRGGAKEKRKSEEKISTEVREHRVVYGVRENGGFIGG